MPISSGIAAQVAGEVLHKKGAGPAASSLCRVKMGGVASEATAPGS